MRTFPLFLLFVGCQSIGSPTELLDTCRWQKDEQVEIDWREGEQCRVYCGNGAYFVTDVGGDQEKFEDCALTQCEYFYLGADTHVQFWRDPLEDPTGSLQPEDWWIVPCEEWER